MVEIVRDENAQFVAPSGQNVPLMREELRWRLALRDAKAAGDLKAELKARMMLGATIQANRPVEPPEPTPWERFGHGAAQLPAGVAQLAPESMGGMSPAEERSFAEGEDLYRQAVPGFDPLSMAGEMASQGPLAAIPGVGPSGLLARVGTGAATEGAIGGALFAGSHQERARNAVAGGIGGGIGSALVPAVTAVTRRGANLVPRKLPKREVARQEMARRFGYEPTRGQLSREGAEWGDEANLAKQAGGEELAARFDAQRAQDLVNLDDLQGAYGGPTFPGDAGAVLEEAVQNRSRTWQGEVSDLYDLAKRERPTATVPGIRLEQATIDVMDEVDLPAAVTRRIRNLAEKPGGITPVDLEKFDKLLTNNQGINDATDRAMGVLKQRVRGVIDEAGEEYGGAYREAVRAARERFDALGPMGKMVHQLERGKLDPIKVVPRIKSAGIRELGALRDFVEKDYPEAWQKMRAGLASDLAQAATKSGGFSQAAYNNYINKLGPERLTLLFGEEGTSELFDFGKVARELYSAPRGSTMNTSNTNISARRGLDGVLRRVLGAVYLGGLYDTVAEAGAKRANVRQAAAALNPNQRIGLLPQSGRAATYSRALGAGGGGVIGRELLGAN